MHLKTQLEQIISEPFMEEMIRIRRHLHRFPELSFQEHNTSAYIRELLDKWGISYSYPWVGTGILARIKGGSPGPVIALRTDMDALPVNEQSGLEFASENPGVMHACGHDVHMTSMLGAIRVLNGLKEQIAGELLFIFQPGEEKVPGGAKLMMEEGIFRDTRPSMIIAQHVLPDMEAGHVGFREGTYMASSDEIYITVHGKGGHGALPQQVADPILMASHILISLQHEIHRKSPSEIPTVLSFGKVLADGAVNVIPDQVRLEGTFRTMNERWRKEAHQLIAQVAGGIASSMGGSAGVEIKHGYPVLKNHDGITRLATGLATELLGPEQVEPMDIRMTAEDFAWFTQEIPGMMYRLGVRAPGSADVFPLHTSGFRVDEASIRTGISVLSYLSIEMLKNCPV
jgi:amidohydrolase